MYTCRPLQAYLSVSTTAEKILFSFMNDHNNIYFKCFVKKCQLQYITNRDAHSAEQLDSDCWVRSFIRFRIPTERILKPLVLSARMKQLRELLNGFLMTAK